MRKYNNKREINNLHLKTPKEPKELKKQHQHHENQIIAQNYQ